MLRFMCDLVLPKWCYDDARTRLLISPCLQSALANLATATISLPAFHVPLRHETGTKLARRTSLATECEILAITQAAIPPFLRRAWDVASKQSQGGKPCNLILHDCHGHRVIELL